MRSTWPLGCPRRRLGYPWWQRGMLPHLLALRVQPRPRSRLLQARHREQGGRVRQAGRLRQRGLHRHRRCRQRHRRHQAAATATLPRQPSRSPPRSRLPHGCLPCPGHRGWSSTAPRQLQQRGQLRWCTCPQSLLRMRPCRRPRQHATRPTANRLQPQQRTGTLVGTAAQQPPWLPRTMHPHLDSVVPILRMPHATWTPPPQQPAVLTLPLLLQRDRRQAWGRARQRRP